MGLLYLSTSDDNPKYLFTCKDGTHISSSFVCDFKPDCEDNSDEEFCGKWYKRK